MEGSLFSFESRNPLSSFPLALNHWLSLYLAFRLNLILIDFCFPLGIYVFVFFAILRHLLAFFSFSSFPDLLRAALFPLF